MEREISSHALFETWILLWKKKNWGKRQLEKGKERGKYFNGLTFSGISRKSNY